MRSAALGWMLASGCGALQVLDEGTDDDPVDTRPGRDTDRRPDEDTGLPEDTSPFDTDAPDTDTDTDTLLAYPEIDPVSVRIFAQVGIDASGGVANFSLIDATGARVTYASALFVEFQDAVGFECQLGFLLPQGTRAGDLDLQSWLTGRGLLSGFRVQTGVTVAFGPFYGSTSNNTCTFAPTSSLANNPHEAWLADPVTGQPGSARFGIGNTLSADWTTLLAGLPVVNPSLSAWATSGFSTPYDLPAGLTVSPVNPREGELGGYGIRVDDTMLMQESASGSWQYLIPAQIDVGGRASPGVYLLESITLPWPTP